MVTLLSTVGEALLKNRTDFTLSKKGFALAGTKVRKSSFQGAIISYKPALSTNGSAELFLKEGLAEILEGSSASIQLPQTLLSSQTTDKNDLIFVAYDHGKLFQEKGRSRLNSKVISAEVTNAKISGLDKPVITKFKIRNESKSVGHVCAWWDFNLYGELKTLTIAYNYYGEMHGFIHHDYSY